MSVKKPLAIVATAAMVMTGASFGSAAASAAPITGPEYTPSSDILTTTGDTESAAYNSWHFDPSHGQVVEQAKNGIVVAGSAEAPGDVLIVQGNGNDLNPVADATGLAEVLGELGVNASSTDKVQYQVPVRVDVDGDGIYTAGTDQWSTLRASVADPTVWTTSKAIGQIGANKTGTIDQFAGISGIYPIATGLLVQKNTENVLVSSFTNGDTVTKFYAAPTAPSIGLETSEYVAAADIRPDESSYAGWHNGAPAGGSFATVEGAHGATSGLEVTGKAQILNGFADEEFQSGGLEFANSLAIEVAPGGDAVFAQVPVFYYADGQERNFTTLRAEVTAGGFTDETVWTNSGSVAGIAGNQGTIAQYTEAMGQHEVIGYGFLVDTGKKATVRSISFNGATTNFTKAADPLEPAVPGEASTTYVDADGIRPNEESYAGWHDGTSKTATERNFKTLAGAHGATTGLEVSGKAQILNGFADADFQRNALEFANGMTVTVAAGSDAVFAQLPVFYGQDGKSFTTLRAEITADGFTTDTVWTNSGTVAGITGNKGTIADYTAAMGKHDVIGYGFFVDTGKKATVTSISFNGATTNFSKAADPLEPAVPGEASTTYVDAEGIRPNEAEYAGWHDGTSKTATERNFETVVGKHGATTGLKVSGKAQILNGFADADFQRNALEFANGMTVTVAAGSDAVFAQLPVFYGQDGKSFTTLRAEVTADGFTTDTVWTNSGTVAGITGNKGTIAQYTEALGKHEVIGYGFFVDTAKTATVESISFNGATTNFTKAADPIDPSVPGEVSKVYLDADGIRPNEAEYAGWHDGVSKTATERNFTTLTRANGATTGLKVSGKSQILNGFADADFQRNALDFADEMTMKVAADSDAVFAQIPVFYGKDNSFTTLRAEVPASGKLADAAEWITSKAIAGSDIKANEAASLESIIDAMGNHDVIGYGFYVDTAQTATVESITFNGATTDFTKAADAMDPAVPGKKTTTYVDAAGIRPNEATYTGWHDGTTKTATKRNFSTIAGKNGATLGLKVSGKAQILNGFADAEFQRNALNFADEMTVKVQAGSDEVFAQIPVFYGKNQAFTTLRAVVPASGKLADVAEWTTSKAIAGTGIGANEAASLESIIDALGNHDVIGYGFFVDTAKTATVESISFNGATTNFTKAEKPVTPKPPIKLSDVSPKTTKFVADINWMVNAGITTGIKQPNGSYKFEPAANVSREAMAAFLYRAYATKADKATSAPKVSPFADVKTTDKFYKEIAWMSTKKFSTGVKQPVGKPHFQPKANITREAMAAFVYRINGGPSSPVPKSSIFADVKPGHKFFKEIAWLGDTGLSTGFKQSNGSKIYGSQLNTTREAMAAFLHRAYKKF